MILNVMLYTDNNLNIVEFFLFYVTLIIMDIQPHTI